MSPVHSGPARGVIIVGPGQHFGIELVRRFRSEGYRIGIIARREVSLAEIRMIGGSDDDVLTESADVSDATAFSDALVRLAVRLGTVDGLIYNPKVSFKASALGTRAADLDHAMTVNVTGAMVAVQTLLPWLEPAGGSVVLTGGGYKDEPAPDKFALSVGKAGLHALYRALNQPLQRRGVRMKTIVIDGAIRRGAEGASSSALLADFYWSIFEGGASKVHRFPRKTSVSDQMDMLF
ncbi:SDR family NAD(P)-dependent oxidoreductase [Sphingomonas sp. NFX23]|uniref:SDR family NAD(P)-dependent oxidoreductase n=1 Tax=Sphingomonas sp. NFX23 TaxID=2819532 RepID=UPI003CEC5A06